MGSRLFKLITDLTPPKVIADCRLPIADCRLPIADCRLLLSGKNIQIKEALSLLSG
jgi:hypothetical protein